MITIEINWDYPITKEELVILIETALETNIILPNDKIQITCTLKTN